MTLKAVQEIVILIVSPEAETMQQWLKEALDNFNIAYCPTHNCHEGFDAFARLKPPLIIVDGNVEDMNAMSFGTIIKDMAVNNDCYLYLYHVEKILQNTKADFFCINERDDELKEAMQAQVRSFLNARFMKYNHSDEINIARSRQLEQLPKPLETPNFNVYNIFSPLSELSGDGLDYWLSKDGKDFFGFLFDCTGHDINSNIQGGTLRAFIKKGCMFFHTRYLQSLADVFHDVNNDLFELDAEPLVAAAIIFYIDCEKNVMTCCSAGIPAFYMRRVGEDMLKPVMLKNYLLGYEPDVVYDEIEVNLNDVEEIMFTSDGFSELFYHKKDLPKKNIAKHDDVSAIKINIKR